MKSRQRISDLGFRTTTALLNRLPAETAHEIALRLLPFAPRRGIEVPAGLSCDLAGLALPHPIGLAAGFDKDARCTAGLFRLGFSMVEVGTITPRPQPGNPRPRLFRLREDGALINRMGFNNAGIESASPRLHRSRGVLGVNIGCNKDSVRPVDDYRSGLGRLYDLADYTAINISSPNTPGLRDLQERKALRSLLRSLGEARAERISAGAGKRPIFLKVAPDLDLPAASTIAEEVLGAGIDGLIVTNTTTSRPLSLKSSNRNETGGLSGKPLFEPSTKVLRHVARVSEGRLALIGVGGILSGRDAYEKFKVGADALQIYTGFVLEGPSVIDRLLCELATLMQRDGVSHLAQLKDQMRCSA